MHFITVTIAHGYHARGSRFESHSRRPLVIAERAEARRSEMKSVVANMCEFESSSTLINLLADCAFSIAMNDI